MIIDFIIEDLLLDSYLQKNFHTPLIYKHADFSGEAFSYGDKVIADTANGIAIKSGNLTNWVGYSLNHHITLICTL